MSLAAAAAPAKSAPRSAVTSRAAERCDLSVVIVSWNACTYLEACLTSLFDGGGLDGVARPEVWVIDNASEDGSAAQVRRRFPQVRLIESEAGNVGFSRGANAGLRRASGHYVLLLNPDTVVPRGALAALIRALDDHPGAALAAPLLRHPDGRPQPNWARFPGIRSEATGRLDRSQSPYPLADFADGAARARMEAFAVDWAGGACLLARAEVIRAVGLLDEGFFLYGEETDWCRRFRDAGWRTLLVPGVTVTHVGGGSSRRLSAAAQRADRLRGMRRYYRRAYGAAGGFLPSSVASVRTALGSIKAR